MKRFGVCALVLSLVSLALADDVVVLENGREAHGRIVEETDAGVKLDVGGGKMFYPRAKIKEIRRDSAAAKPVTEAAPEPAAEEAREEYSLIYDDGRRAGARTYRIARGADGFRFEEEIVFLDAKGLPEMAVRTTERADLNYQPLSFQVRETAGGTNHRMVIGEVRGGRLYVTVMKDGDKTQDDAVLPENARFPFAARELFLRDSKALGGKLDANVYDTRDQRWRPTTYAEGGRKPVVADGKALDVRVVLRKRGQVTEREWLDEKLNAHMSELNGETLRAMSSTMDVVGRVKRGDSEKVTGPDSAARMRYADAEGGWKIGKPDPSWTFEEAAVRGAGALLAVKNAGLFASVDVMRDVTAPPDVTLERAAESLERLCRSIAPDFKVVKSGFDGKDAGRYYWLEATATTKGEKTRTLARVVVRKGKVWRLLAASPEGSFEAVRADFTKVLDSFVVE